MTDPTWTPTVPGQRDEGPMFLRVYHLPGEGKAPRVPNVRGWLSKGARDHFAARGEGWVAISRTPEHGRVEAIRLLGLPAERPDGLKLRTDKTVRGSVLRRMQLPDRLRIDLHPDPDGALVGCILWDGDRANADLAAGRVISASELLPESEEEPDADHD